MLRMRRLWLASLLAAAAASAPSAQDADRRGTTSAASITGVMTPALSPRNASYTITARLDPASRTITGSETITWRNITARPAADLQFHLLERVEEHALHLHARARVDASGDDRRRRPDGGRTSTSPRSRSAAAIARRQRFITPDDDNPSDETVLVPLAQPIDPAAAPRSRS
jgi:hypothetical protein